MIVAHVKARVNCFFAKFFPFFLPYCGQSQDMI